MVKMVFEKTVMRVRPETPKICLQQRFSALLGDGDASGSGKPRLQIEPQRFVFGVVERTSGITLASMQLAQVDVYYYGYWVYDDLTDYYYWFPADYVIVDSSWVEYTA